MCGFSRLEHKGRMFHPSHQLQVYVSAPAHRQRVGFSLECHLAFVIGRSFDYLFPALLRLPLRCRLRKSGNAASEFRPRKPLAEDARHCGEKAALVAVFVFALVEAKHPEVTEKVEGLDADIGSLDRPFQQAPKIFEPVRVNAVFT